MTLDIARLNLKMCDYAVARLNAMGRDPGGLYNYYDHLAHNGTMLRPEELAVAEYIERTVPQDKAILELCAGAAQLGHLLSLMGRRVSAAEIDPRRHAFAADLGAYLGSRCEVLPGQWQRFRLDSWHLLVTINAVTTFTAAADVVLLVEHARHGGEFIIRPRQFGPGIPAEIAGLHATQVFEDVYHYRA